MTLQLSDIPRILPEFVLILLMLLVVGSDVLDSWGDGPEAQAERTRTAWQLSLVGVGLIFLVTLVQSRLLFVVGDPLPEVNILNRIANLGLNLLRNLQAGGPGQEPLLGAIATDYLAMIARLIVLGVTFLTILLSHELDSSTTPGEYYGLLLTATVGLLLLVSATELITAYVALELASVSLYVLIGSFSRAEAPAANRRMTPLRLGMIGSGVLLYGMSLIYGFVASASRANSAFGVIGTLFSEIGQATSEVSSSPLLLLALLLVILGFGLKLALLPSPNWLPETTQRIPTPLAGFLVVALRVAGLVALFRLLTTALPGLVGSLDLLGGDIGWAVFLGLLALVMLLSGPILALFQQHLKPLLAWLSLGQFGFALLALLLWGSVATGARQLSVVALLYGLAAFAVAMIGAFGAVSVVERATGGSGIEHLSGLSRRHGGLAALLTVFLLSLAGLPPLAGFWLTVLPLLAAYRADALPLVIIAAVMSVVSLAALLRPLRAIWIETPPLDSSALVLSRRVGTALLIATILILLFGVFPGLMWETLSRAAA